MASRGRKLTERELQNFIDDLDNEEDSFSEDGKWFLCISKDY